MSIMVLVITSLIGLYIIYSFVVEVKLVYRYGIANPDKKRFMRLPAVIENYNDEVGEDDLPIHNGGGTQQFGTVSLQRHYTVLLTGKMMPALRFSAVRSAHGGACDQEFFDKDTPVRVLYKPHPLFRHWLVPECLQKVE